MPTATDSAKSEEAKPDSKRGYLLVDHNVEGEVVINLDHDRTGHIVFSPQQAFDLGMKLVARSHVARDVARLQELRLILLPFWAGHPSPDADLKKLGELAEEALQITAKYSEHQDFIPDWDSPCCCSDCCSYES